MPELPEVQAVVDGLAQVLPGRRVERITVRRADLARPSAAGLRRRVEHRSFATVTRRAKNVLIRTDGDVVVRIHLGMTGQLLFAESGRVARTGYTGVTFRFTDGARLVYSDVRRFGKVEALSVRAWDELERRIGPEPFARDLDGPTLHGRLQGSAAPIRSWLLDPARIAGVGNIYAVEALHGAGIHPARPAQSLDPAESGRLLRTLRHALRLGMRAGGTTLRDYRNIDGQEGENAKNLRAYGREGSACFQCGDSIQRLVFGGRSAFLCPTCQPSAP